MAQFVIDQVGLPAGVLDVSRTDGLDTGVTVTIDAAAGGGNTFKFELLWVPPGDTTAEATLAATGNPAIWTFVPTALRYGTYRIRLTVDGGEQGQSIVIRTFSIRTVNSMLVIPAVNTIADETASLVKKGPLQVVASEDNATDYAGTLSALDYTGWWRAMHELISMVDILASGGGGGEVNTALNVGSGTGLIFRDKTGIILNLRSLLEGTRIQLTNNVDDITIATDAELNTGSNIGAGAGLVFSGKSSEDFEFRTLTGTGGIVVSVNVGVVEIDGSGISGGGEANLGANVGSGADVFRDKISVTLNFRGINGTNGLGAVVNVDNIDVGAITGTRDYNNQDLIDVKTVTLNGAGPLDNGSSGASATVDFADAQQQTITLTAAAPALTIDPPVGPANGLVLFIVQDATGGRLPTFSSNVKWSNNGTVPTFTADPNAVDIVHFVYDGTDMFGFFNENFA